MPKVNVYLPDELAAAVRDAQLPVSGICQAALERAVRDVTAARGADEPPAADTRGIGMFSRFTGRARSSIGLAEQSARAFHHNNIGTEHVLLGIIEEGNNLAIKVLTALDIDLEDLAAELVASMAPATHAPEGQIPFTSSTKRALELTTTEALRLGHNYIGTEHLLLGVLATEDGRARQVLRRMGVELHTTRRAVVTALTGFVYAQQDVSTSRPPEGDTLEQILRRLNAIEERLAG